MQGLVFPGGSAVSLREFADPTPGAGEVVVQIKASGMCGTDLHAYRRPGMPEDEGQLNIAGHEPAGVVVAVGSEASSRAMIGDRVMVFHYDGCMSCDSCRSGWYQMCTGGGFELFGQTKHGAHAPLMVVPVTSLVPLDDALSFEAGASIGCGTGTGWGALERVGEVGGQTVAVFGQGPVGLSTTMLAAARGAEVIAVDLALERLEMARHFGAAHVIDAKSDDPVEIIHNLTGGRGASVVIETSGSVVAATQALSSLAQWGRMCVVGLGGRVDFSPAEHLQTQATIMTSWSMSIVAQRRCAAFAVKANLPIDQLFSHRWSLDEAERAYTEFNKQDAGKGVFLF